MILTSVKYKLADLTDLLFKKTKNLPPRTFLITTSTTFRKERKSSHPWRIGSSSHLTDVWYSHSPPLTLGWTGVEKSLAVYLIWVWVYRKDKTLGERQYKQWCREATFNYGFLAKKTNSSLTGMLTILIEEF